jgi:hypothetical protein
VGPDSWEDAEVGIPGEAGRGGRGWSGGGEGVYSSHNGGARVLRDGRKEHRTLGVQVGGPAQATAAQ